MRFVAVGDLMLDVLVSGSGNGAEVAVSAGGSAANAAVWAAALGAEAVAAEFLLALAAGRTAVEALADGAACGGQVAACGRAWPGRTRVSP
ncbi:MAG TPA: hypothetical protein VFA44_11950 [Gaiellaceae bacterium]|nr:hypothetical protein [Gaiellaceae bacterium]